MAKKSPLSVDEWKLLSWRAGMKLGSAIDHHRHAHWYLKQKESASGKKSSTPDINLPFALASEGCEECGKLVRRGPRLTAEDEEWTREFVKAVDARLDAGYEAIRNHLREQGEEIAAFFDLAVRASIWITSPSDPANLSRLAYVAGVTDECMSPFLKALGPETERDAFRQQLAHFDQCVERNLLYGASKSPSGDDR
jgi:hypothetical protein